MHHLRPAPGAKKAKTRVGRGEASKGKTAGRGTKGTKARNTVPFGFEGGQMPLHMRLPKLRGFTNPFRVEYQPVNLATLQELFPEGGTVTVDVIYPRLPIVQLRDQDPDDTDPFLNPGALDINKGNKQIAHGIFFVLRPANL